VAWNHACEARLGSRDAESTATNGGLVVAAWQFIDLSGDDDDE
jgi:hypothetical protein